jgi:hypothetical protein
MHCCWDHGGGHGITPGGGCRTRNHFLDGRNCPPVASAGGTFFVYGRRLAWSGRSAASPAAREAFGITGVPS